MKNLNEEQIKAYNEMQKEIMIKLNVNAEEATNMILTLSEDFVKEAFKGVE